MSTKTLFTLHSLVNHIQTHGKTLEVVTEDKLSHCVYRNDTAKVKITLTVVVVNDTIEVRLNDPKGFGHLSVFDKQDGTPSQAMSIVRETFTNFIDPLAKKEAEVIVFYIWQYHQDRISSLENG